MSRKYPSRRADPRILLESSRGWTRGLNQLTHPSAIRNDELAEAQNILYTGNGVLSKRPGSVDLGAIRGSSTRVLSLAGVYKIGVGKSDYLLRISSDGIIQKHDFNTSTWSDVTSSPTFSNVDTTILQAYGFVYFLNSVDPMIKWDGTTFTTFTALANPSSAPTVAKTGAGTGSTTYYYRYVWFNNVGNTLSSSNVSIGSMPSKLDTVTYVTVTLPAAPAGTVKTGIWRGTTSGDEIYLDSVPAAQLSYVDKGQAETDPLYAIPQSNTTGGFHFKFAAIYNNTLIGVTTELGDDTLVFSAGADKFDSFGRADGGGYYGWRRDDGDPMTGLGAFQEKLYVFKGRKVGAFIFDTAGGVVKDINLAVGAVSHRSIHSAGNDLRFWGREGAMSLGNEPNFADIIRTKVLSARADNIVRSMTPADFQKIAGTFFKNISIWGIPLGTPGQGITSSITYDERYVAWSEWKGITPNVWVRFIDSDNVERLFYGDDQSGNVVECWQGTTDRGNPVVFRATTKQYDMNKPQYYKTFNRAYFIFGNITGVSTRITLIEDGIRSQLPLAIFADQGTQGFGNNMWGTTRFGETAGSYENVNTSGLLVRYTDLGNKDLFSLQATYSNNGLADSLQIMGMYIEYSDSSAPPPSSFRLSRIVSS